MGVRKIVLPLLIGLLVCTNLVYCQEKNAVSQVALDYMNSINAGRFDDAMRFILPSQLENLRIQMVPIFIRFIKSNNSDLKDFGIQVIGSDEDAWNTVDGARIFTYLIQLGLSQQGAVAKERMARTKLEVVDVVFTNESNNARVQISARADTDTYFVYGDLVRTDSGWFVDFGTKIDAMLQQFKEIVEKSGI